MYNMKSFFTWSICVSHGGGLDADGMTRAYFWRLFGNLNITKEDKKLLDTNEDYRGKRKQVRQLSFEDFESQLDTAKDWSNKKSYSGRYALRVGKDQERSRKIIVPTKNISEKWLRISAKFFAPAKEWEKWKMCRLIVECRKEEKVVKKNMIRIFRVYGQGSWGDIFIDVSTPDEEFDNVAVYLFNAGSDKEVFMDDLKIEAFEEE